MEVGNALFNENVEGDLQGKKRIHNQVPDSRYPDYGGQLAEKDGIPL